MNAVTNLADGQDLVFRHGTQPGGPHDWFISRRHNWVLLHNRALDIHFGTFPYETVRNAFLNA